VRDGGDKPMDAMTPRRLFVGIDALGDRIGFFTQGWKRTSSPQKAIRSTISPPSGA